MPRRLVPVLPWIAGAVLAVSTLRGFSADPFLPPSAPQQDPRIPGYGAVPGPATMPSQPIRPESWPGGMTPEAAAAITRPLPYPVTAEALPCEGAQVLARVGTDVVLTRDVLMSIDELLARNKDKIPADQMEAQRQQIIAEVTAGINELLAHLNDPNPGAQVSPQRRALIQQLLRQQIETRLIYQDFRSTLPPEAIPNIEQNLTKEFEDKELKKLLKRENVDSRRDLEAMFRAKGSSLEREKQAFMQRVVSQQWIHQQLKIEKEVTHEQMLTWYQAHVSEFETPARARWEELMVRTSKFSTKDEAYAAIAQMGNRVLSGVPLAEVARHESDGPTAAKGGFRDWTSKGSLVSPELDRALFGLPLGQLSPIIEGPTGLHIVRVSEREDVKRTPFLAAQTDVEEKIRQERTKKQYQEYVDRIRKQFPVWTIFDNPTGKPRDADEDERRQ